jgi:hypothetical protein
MPQPLINGRARDWAQVSITILGKKVVGVTDIEYEEELKIEDNYGIGQEPVSRGEGSITYKASVTFLAEEVDKLEEIAPNGNIYRIPEFPIIVQFLEGAKVRTHTLQNCRFTKNGRKMKSGDTKIEVQIPLAIAGIVRV